MSGDVVATDGRQILIQGGFRFPWDDDLLIPHTPLFSCRGLPRDQPVSVGKSDSHVVFRTGDWTIWLTIKSDARYPRIADVIPDERSPASRLRLAPEDAAFLEQALDRLPGGEAMNAPVTLDLNGRVSVRAQDRGSVTELILARSRYGGEPARVSTSRQFLSRAMRLGFTEVQVQSPDDPVVCRDPHRIYLWQPLSKDSAIEPTDDAVRIESTNAGPASGPAVTPRGAHTMSHEESPNFTPDRTRGPPRTRQARRAQRRSRHRYRSGGAGPGSRRDPAHAGRGEAAYGPADRGPAAGTETLAPGHKHPGHASPAQTPGSFGVVRSGLAHTTRFYRRCIICRFHHLLTLHHQLLRRFSCPA